MAQAEHTANRDNPIIVRSLKPVGMNGTRFAHSIMTGGDTSREQRSDT